MNALARQSTVSDLIEEYDQKRTAMEGEVKAFEDGSFSESGTNVPTGILKIRKVAA